MMDGKKESLYTDGNTFLSLHNHHFCNGKSPDKAGTFLVAHAEYDSHKSRK